MIPCPDSLNKEELIHKASTGEIIVIDVRPGQEFEQEIFFLPNSCLTELKQRLEELPKNKPVIAYCRDPYCLLSVEAVTLLRQYGYKANRMKEA